MAQQRDPMDVNTSKQNVDMDQAGQREQSLNVTGAGETSRSANQDDIANPKAKTQAPGSQREFGRADTDTNSDLSTDSDS